MGLNHSLRFIIIQGILISGILALYIQGILGTLFVSNAKWAVIGISAFAMYGLFKAFTREWDDLAFCSQMLVRLGIIGMQIAAAGAITLIATQAVGVDMESSLKTFLILIGQGLYASIVALVWSVIVDANAHFLGGNND